MPGNDGVEVQLQHAGEGGRPFDRAAPVPEVPERRQRRAVQPLAVDEQVAGVNGTEVGEVDHRVAVRVTPPVMVRLHLRAAEEHRGLVGEDDARRARLVVADDIVARVPMCDHLGVAQEVGVAPGVVPMVMRVENVLDRLVGNATDLRGDEIEAVGELVVDDDHAVAGHPYRDVAARLRAVESRNHVETVRHLADLQPRFLLRRERGLLLTAGHDQHRGGDDHARQDSDSLQLSHRMLLTLSALSHPRPDYRVTLRFMAGMDVHWCHI